MFYICVTDAHQSQVSCDTDDSKIISCCKDLALNMSAKERVEPLTILKLVEAYSAILPPKKGSKDKRFSEWPSSTLAELAKLQGRYDHALLSGLPENPNTLADVLGYVMARLPIAVFFPECDTVNFSNCPDDFVGPTACSQRPKSRARLYAIGSLAQEENQPSMQITTQIRDQQKHGLTDWLETCSMLASAEQVRQACTKLMQDKSDITPIQEVFQQQYLRQLEYLEEKLNVMLREDTTEEKTNAIRAQLQIIKQKLEEFGTNSGYPFWAWVNNRKEIKLKINPDKLDLNQDPQNTCVWRTVRSIAEWMSKNGYGENPDPANEEVKQKPSAFVLFGNDFSIRLLCASGLFDQEEREEIVSLFHGAATEDIKAQTAQISDKQLRENALLFFCIQQLSVFDANTNHDFQEEQVKKLLKFRQRLVDPQSLQKLGLYRIIHTLNSPIGDPIDLWDPKKIQKGVLDNLPRGIRRIVEKFIEEGSPILSIPYTLGALTTQMLDGLRECIAIKGVGGFVGKVGQYADLAEESLEDLDKIIGQVAKAGYVISQDKNKEPIKLKKPSANSISHLGRKPGNRYRRIRDERNWQEADGVILTTLGLTLQGPDDIKEARERAQELVGKRRARLLLDMELYYLAQYLQETDLHWVLFYYISDLTIPPDKFDEQDHRDLKISAPLGNSGVIAVFHTLTATLQEMLSRSHQLNQPKRARTRPAPIL